MSFYEKKNYIKHQLKHSSTYLN